MFQKVLIHTRLAVLWRWRGTPVKSLRYSWFVREEATPGKKSLIRYFCLACFHVSGFAPSLILAAKLRTTALPPFSPWSSVGVNLMVWPICNLVCLQSSPARVAIHHRTSSSLSLIEKAVHLCTVVFWVNIVWLANVSFFTVTSLLQFWISVGVGGMTELVLELCSVPGHC